MISVSKILLTFVLLALATAASAQTAAKAKKQIRTEFGPNVQAYLDYLESELTVTDARESQREVNAEYIRHNFNRVSALRQFAIKLASESEVDYVPEMEAVVPREFTLLFPESAPKISDLKPGETYSSFRYLGSVRNRETFYIFCRLDPFEEEARQGKSPEFSKTAVAPKNDESVPLKIEAKPVEKIEPKPENPRLTRERILYGAGENKIKTAQKQPNQ